MNFRLVFVPSDAVVINNTMDNKLFWLDYKGVREIQYGITDVVGVDII
jgi:hypothetical protein